ncbi:MAG: polysaccharide pyruvyl transferase family protein, partial [Candidatus Thioglobus sp.]
MTTSAKSTIKLASISYNDSSNLGDDIQTIAAIGAIKKLGYEFDGFVDRNNFTPTRPINILLNGFFDSKELHRFTDPLVRLIVSNIHIDRGQPLYSRKRLTIAPESLSGLRAFEPLGARDRSTLALLQAAGFDAFFNYCLTLTLDRRDSSIKGDRIFIVDLDNMLPLPKHISTQKIEYVSQDGAQNYPQEVKLAMAQSLLDRYRSQAKLVITSKLHCALPCIAMGIPVIVFSDQHDER